LAHKPTKKNPAIRPQATLPMRLALLHVTLKQGSSVRST
jgi:hypothetical protein